jgi:hypothetical protein
LSQSPARDVGIARLVSSAAIGRLGSSRNPVQRTRLLGVGFGLKPVHFRLLWIA